MGGEIWPEDVRPRSGQLTLGASGSVSQFPDAPCQRALLMAHPDNSGDVYIGNATGTVSGDNGFPLSTSGPGVPLEGLENLNQMFASPDVNGDKACWIILDHAPALSG